MDGDRKKTGRGKKFLWLVGIVAVGYGVLLTFRVGDPPTIGIEADLPGIGKKTPVTVRFEETKRGLDRLEVQFVQGERVETLVERQYTPRQPWRFWGPATRTDEVEIEVGTQTLQGLVGGDATIRARAWPAGTWLRHPDPRVEELTLPVRLTPPSLGISSIQHYVAQGGAGIVVYNTGETAVLHGVKAGRRWYPGQDVPGDAAKRKFALFAVPFDLFDVNQIQLAAEDDVGNRAVASFVDRLFNRSFRSDTIEVSDNFMQKVVPAIMSATPEVPDQGGLLENYLWINRELRKQNAAAIDKLAQGSAQEFLWNSTFLPMSNSQVMSSFADRRTYVHGGEEVDQQDHLGFDLASVRHDKIEAANSGIVLMARYFGIYGNAVVIDHGFGLMSLYGHLSSIAVSEGDQVEKGQELGRSGETGLAGGDHLHFTMLVQGQPVNPVEWWDGAWIRDRLAAKLEGAFPFEP